MRPLDDSYEPRKGDRILCALAPEAQPYSFCTVTRVARDRTWVDLRLYSAGAYWSKRQPLPWRIKTAMLASPNHDDAYLLGLLWDPSSAAPQPDDNAHTDGALPPYSPVAKRRKRVVRVNDWEIDQ